MFFLFDGFALAQTMDVFTSPVEIRLCANPHRKVSLSYVCQYTDELLCVVYIACPGKFTAKSLRAVSTWNEVRSVALC